MVHAEIRVDRLPVQRQKPNATGLTGVPFGIQPIASHNFFLQIAYYIGLEDDSDMGIKYLYQGDTWDFTRFFQECR
ncbi:MAG: hypothetical protein ACLU4N_06315 [Butyricimonas faecihominis]